MAFVMAAFLDLSPSRHLPRATMAATLWPLSTASSASNNLRQLLSDVRAWELACGLQVFQADHQSIGRNSLTVPTDAWLLAQMSSVESTEALEHLSELYRGDLLEGVEDLVGDTGIWLIAARQRLRDRFISLAIRGGLRERNETAEQVLARAALVSPYEEEITRTQMIVAAAMRRPAEVGRVYQNLASRLGSELGASPEEATSRLLLELNSGASVNSDKLSKALKPAVPKILILPPSTDGLERTKTRGEMALCHSLVEDITHALSGARTFALFAPHTARQLALEPFPRGNPYGANYLVGTTLLAGSRNTSRFRFAVTDLDSQELLLSEEVGFEPGDLRRSHDSVVAELSSKIAEQIERNELNSVRAGGTPSAYTHYLVGNEELRGVDLPAVRRARRSYQQSLREAPHFARARAMLARTYSVEFLLLGRGDAGPLEQALSHAQKAIEIDATDPVPRRELGHALIYLGRLDDAVDCLELASDRGPHFSDVLCTFADSLVHVGRNTEARDVMDRALSLNPIPPDLYHWISATSHYMLGDYESAKLSIRRMSYPRSAGRIMAASEALSGNHEAAFYHRDLFMADNPDFSLSNYVFPVRDPNREHLIGGMRAAGFH